MKALTTLLPLLLMALAYAADAPSQQEVQGQSHGKVHRYLIERSFPRGTLDVLDLSTKEQANATSASLGVRWIRTYANEDMTKTYCVYEGPSEEAVRKAAQLKSLPIDSIIEIPVDPESGIFVPPNKAREGRIQNLSDEGVVRTAFNTGMLPR